MPARPSLSFRTAARSAAALRAARLAALALLAPAAAAPSLAAQELALPRVGVRFVPLPGPVTWSVSTFQGTGGNPDSDQLIGALSGGGSLQIVVSWVKDPTSCTALIARLEGNGAAQRALASEFPAPAGWHPTVLRTSQGLVMLCHDEPPRALTAIVVSDGAPASVPGTVRLVLEPMFGASAPPVAAAPASPAPSSGPSGDWTAAVVAALPGGPATWSAGAFGNGGTAFTRRGMPALTLNTVPLTQDMSCATAMGEIAKRGTGTPVDRPRFLPAAYHPTAIRGTSGTAVCLGVPSRATYVVAVVGDVDGDASAIYAALDAMARTLSPGAAAPVGGPSPTMAPPAAGAGTGLRVQLQKSRVSFFIPAGSWRWEVQPSDNPDNAGAMILGTGPGGQSLGISAVPASVNTTGNDGRESPRFPGGCMDAFQRLGYTAERAGDWIPSGFSQYMGLQGDNLRVACLVRPDAYYFVGVVGNVEDRVIHDEALRILQIIRDATQ